MHTEVGDKRLEANFFDVDAEKQKHCRNSAGVGAGLSGTCTWIYLGRK
jgi:hypothetical protein